MISRDNYVLIVKNFQNIMYLLLRYKMTNDWNGSTMYLKSCSQKIKGNGRDVLRSLSLHQEPQAHEAWRAVDECVLHKSLYSPLPWFTVSLL